MSTPLPNVVWIRLEKPSFDLIGVVLSSLGLAGVCALVAFSLGVCWGLVLIRRSRVRLEPELGLGLSAEAH